MQEYQIKLLDLQAVATDGDRFQAMATSLRGVYFPEYLQAEADKAEEMSRDFKEVTDQAYAIVRQGGTTILTSQPKNPDASG